MKDNSDIPLPIDEIRSRVLVFAIVDQSVSEYEQITKGYVELSTDEDEHNRTFHYLEVKDEKTNEVLMRSNLKIENNFGKQKGTIISWTDQEQPEYQQIALSFEKDRECDMFWRTICQKIGKSYLQINGKDKLQTPTSQNLNYILEKAKNNIDLVDYNIVHSKSVTQGLKQVFYEMKKTNDEMGMGIIARIINSIFSPSYSLNAIQTMLAGNNFYLVLDVQQYKKRINFREIYDSKIGNSLSNKFNLPKEVFQKIQISHRATFYRQNVLDLVDEAQLQSIMFMICKQVQVEIVSFLNRSKFFENWKSKDQCLKSIIQLDNQQQSQKGFPQKQSPQQNYQPLIQSSQDSLSKIRFIQEALIMYQHISSQQIKSSFKQNIYNSGILGFIKEEIQNGSVNAVQILFYICQIDKIRFFEYLVEDFKKNSSDNLLKTIMKRFLNHPEFKHSILSLIESFSLVFNLKKECFDFFNGTFLCSMFSLAKDLNGVLFLINILLTQLQNVSSLFNQIVKFKILEKIVNEYRSGAGLKRKSQQLEIIKLLKHVLIEMSYKNEQKNKEIQKSVIDSGYFDICLMIYMKHSQKYNIISSSMLQNFKLIQRMPYSSLDAYLVKQSSQYQLLTKLIGSIIKKHVDHMNSKRNNNMVDQYIQVQQYAHEQLLENQHQDEYLMKDQVDLKPENYASTTKQEEQHHLSTEINDQMKKQSYIQYLKRIINEVKQEDDSIVPNSPRKLVKKSQQTNQQPILQLTFDLPDMDDLDIQSSDRLKDT